MKIHELSLSFFEIPLIRGGVRSGALLKLTEERGKSSLGEISPLPNWSLETLEEATIQLEDKKKKILSTKWDLKNLFHEINACKLFPSVSFGLESALLSLLDPLPFFSVPKSALLMGSLKEILDQGALRKKEGYTSAKLKVSSLTFEEAYRAISELKDVFHLRVDVNRSWKTKESLAFFAKFPLDTFDYVEEPFQDPKDLRAFQHPLAIDESFPKELSLEQLQSLPNLKALVYKPTMQGGLSVCLPLLEWCNKQEVDLVLSSSFESDIGLRDIASLAHRLGLNAPIGTGTNHFLQKH